MSHYDGKALEILFVENDAAERALLQKFFKCRGRRCRLHFATDGEEARRFLFPRAASKASIQECPTPDLVFIDHGLEDGRKLLREIKRCRGLKHIPVVMFTDDCSFSDVRRCYEEQANCCISKPSDLDSLAEVLQTAERFWVGTAHLPSPRVA